MPAFSCDVCGGKIVSSGKHGWFVCENYGSEYPTEWMKAKYQQGKRIQIEGIAALDNILIRAQQYFDQGDYKKVILYCNRVLDIEADNSLAKQLIELSNDMIIVCDSIADLNYERAQACLTRALEMCPSNSSISSAAVQIREAKKIAISGRTLVSYHGDNDEYHIPHGITTIGESAFVDAGVSSLRLKKLVLPDTLLKIDKNAFRGHSKLECVRWENGQPPIYGHIIEDSAFQGCINLKEMAFPTPMVRIGRYAFEGCTSLEGNLLLDSIHEIGEKAFYGCTRLKGIHLNLNSFWGGEETARIGQSALCTRGDAKIVVLEYGKQIDNNWPVLERAILSEEEYKEKHRSEYRNKGVCQCCGGEIKGLFLKTCSKCGKTKDY